VPFLVPIGAAIAGFGSAVAGTLVAAGLGVAAGGGAFAALAGGLLTSVGAGVASLTGALGIASAISSWSTVALFASSFLSKPKVGIGSAGSQVNLQADPSAGIPCALGRTGTAGKIVHANTSGQSNKNIALYYLLALTAGPLTALESFSASAAPVTFDGSSSGPGTGLAVAPPNYAQAMFLVKTPGLKPDPQAYYPGGVELPWIPEWTGAHKLSGVACAWLTFVYNTKAYPTGMPAPLFVIQGPPCYDPRHDSTFPGGSGAQRWDDETTWAYSTNPFVHALTWCIGRKDNGRLSFGIGAPIDAIDVAAFVEGANVCDENRWTVGGEVLSSDGKWDVLTTILQAGGGEPIKLGGLISAYVRAPRVALGTLVGADLIGDASITGTKRRRDRLNQIIPSYRSETHGWEMVPADPVFVNEYIAADGGLRSKEGNYPLVQDVAQVAQLATYDILDAREFEPIVLPVGPRWQAIKPGDCILIDEPEFGMAQQPVIVQTRELDLLSGKVTLTCRSETTGKHDYALGKTTNPPPIPGLTPVDPSYVSRPDAGTWTAVGTTLQGKDGSAVPAIVVTGAVNDPNVSGVIVEYQLELDAGPPATFGDWVSAEFPSTTRRMEFRSVISGATYHVQVRYRSVRDVEGALVLDLGLVTVGTSISGGVSQIGGQTPQDLIDQLNETTALGLETSEQAEQTANDLLFTNQNLYDSTHLPDGTPLETYVVNGFAAASAGDAYSVTRVDAMGILRPDGRTFQLSDTTLFADASQTWGQYKTSLQASIGANTAAITQEQTTRANADTAFAQQINNLSTTVGGNTASITNLQNSVNGLNAQWVLAVSATGPGYARVAGIKVAANPAVSSIAFQADQIGFTNGTDPNIFPLAVVGGKVIATNFQADDIKAGTITADKIIGGAVTATVVQQGGQQQNFVGGAVEDLRFNYTSDQGGMLSIAVYGELGTTTNAAAGTVFTLYMDGTDAAHIVGTGSIYCPPSWGGTGLSFPCAIQPPKGPHTFVLWHVGTGGSGASRVNRTEVILTELKK
jgi:hypothetical protein